MELTRSKKGKFAKSVFFEDENEIDVYVEDTAQGYEKLYGLLMSRVFGKKYRVNRVYPVGSRREVINEWKTFQSKGRPYLFIIDGDLYSLTQKVMFCQKGLYVLPCYCVENVLCDQNALENVLDEEETKLSKKDIVDEFNYSDWLKANKQLLIELFIEYAITFTATPSVRTVKNKVSEFVKDGKGNICPNKVAVKISELKEKSLKNVGNLCYKHLRKTAEEMIKKSKFDSINFVSGKDYLFPLLRIRLRSTVRTTMSDLNMKQRLARHSGLIHFDNVQKYIAS